MSSAHAPSRGQLVVLVLMSAAWIVVFWSLHLLDARTVAFACVLGLFAMLVWPTAQRIASGGRGTDVPPEGVRRPE